MRYSMWIVFGVLLLGCDDGRIRDRARDGGWFDDDGTFRPDSGVMIGMGAAGRPSMRPPSTLDAGVGRDGGYAGSGAPPSAAGGSRPPAGGEDGEVPGMPGGGPRAAVYGALVVTEFMVDPAALADDQGEWIELFNPTAQDVDLTGCTIGEHALAEVSRLAGRSYVVIASGEEPGFAGAVVSPLALTNGAGVIEVSCGGVLIDRVAYDKAAEFPIAAGVSAALDPMRIDADENDDAGAWCLAVEEFSTDRGTPGRPNSPCGRGVASTGTEKPAPMSTPQPMSGTSSTKPSSQTPTPPALESGALVITEVMADPKALSDADGEWFELYNTTSQRIDLAGCTIGDGSAAAHLVDESAVIDAGGYATVAGTSEPGFRPTVVSTLSLANSADVIEVRCGEKLIDRVAYDKAAGFPVAAGVASILRSAAPDASGNDSPSAWCLAATEFATDRGTPGRANGSCAVDTPAVDVKPPSAAPKPADDERPDPPPPATESEPEVQPLPYGALVITEIMADPLALSDAAGEWFELYNTTSSRIELSGCTISDGSSEHAIDAPASIGPGDYATVAGADAPGFSPTFVTTLALTNSSDVIEVRCGDALVDRVAYDDSNGFPVAAGAAAALDRAQLDADSNDSPSAWCLAATTYASDLGSPGRANEPCVRETPNVAPAEPAAPPPAAAEPAPEETRTLPYGAVVITEVMADPQALSDSAGEWFELYNATSGAVELSGCVFSDGNGEHVITEPVTIAAFDYATVANSPAPGFGATLAASFSLTNSADVIELRCAGSLVDRVTYDKALGFPLAAGAAAMLDPAHLDADRNDSPSAWCLATLEYAIDRGTPGVANPACVIPAAAEPEAEGEGETPAPPPIEEPRVGGFAEPPAEEAPVGDPRPLDPSDEVPAEEPPAEAPADEAPEPPSQEEPVDEEPVDEEPVDEEPVDEQPVDEQPVDEQPIDEEPVDEEPVDEPPADEPPVDELPVDEPPVEEPEPPAPAPEEEPEPEPAPGEEVDAGISPPA